MAEELAGPPPESWEYRLLAELAGGGIQGGPFGSQLHASDYIPSGIPVIMPKNIGVNRLAKYGFDFISEQDARSTRTSQGAARRYRRWS
jgi:type I restriction enzyme, S subunit